MLKEWRAAINRLVAELDWAEAVVELGEAHNRKEVEELTRLLGQ